MISKRIETKWLVLLTLLLAALVCLTFAACSNSCQHVPGNAVEEDRIDPKCDKVGSYNVVVRCTDCNKVLSSEPHTVAALGHDIVSHDGKASTCQEKGWNEYETCTRCNYSTYKELPLGGHESVEPIRKFEVQPQCEAEGHYYLVVECKYCDKELSAEFVTTEALGHDIVSHATKEQTCTEDGWDAYETCTRCHYSTQNIIPATGHDFSAPLVCEISVDPTCETPGYAELYRRCSKCNEVLEHHHEDYPLTGHNNGEPIEENRIDATCTATGHFDTVVYCKVCKKELSRDTIIIPITHNPAVMAKENVVQPVYGYRNTGTAGGYDEVVRCADCNTVLSSNHVTTQITPQQYYSQYDYLELSSTVNAPTNLVENSDGTHTLTAKTNNGTTVRLLIDGTIGELDGGWGCFDTSTKVYFLDALPGMNFIEYKLASKTTEFVLKGYCSLQQKSSVESVDELFENGGFLIGGNLIDYYVEADMYPDYLCMNGTGTSWQLLSLKIYYCNVMTEVVDIQINTNLYVSNMSNSYLPGDWYDGKIEKGASESFNYGYPLNILLDNPKRLAGPNKYYSSIIEFGDNVKFGNIIDASGTVVDKTNRFLQAGDKIEVTIGNCTRNLDLCTQMYTGKTLYETSTVNYIKSVGIQNVLVVPITFEDQKDRIDDTWMSLLKKALGNVADADGNVTQYSLNNGELSLSEYLSTSSYGKFTAKFYITEPYVVAGSGKDYFYDTVPDWIYSSIEASLHNQNFDNSAFDQNSDGYYDIVLLVNTLRMSDGTGSSYGQGAMSGAYEYSLSMTSAYAGTHEQPTINTCFNVSGLLLFGEKDELSEENVTTHTFIHEFGHTFGILDYYINGQQQNTIGKFDMEADSTGDWNSYTKYILGWVDPFVVDGTQDSVEFKIRSYATYGDVILIRALGYAGTGTPFDEYILIDLFAHDGLYEKDSAKYGLSEAVGVRIYHVNSIYDLTDIKGTDGQSNYFASAHLSADYSSKYSSQGKYLLEMIQKGNVNTFMKDFDVNTCTREDILGTIVDADDLFYAGDSFSVDTYDNFFYNGKMDNGMDFGYTITVKEIVENGAESTATIVISKKSA